MADFQVGAAGEPWTGDQVVRLAEKLGSASAKAHANHVKSKAAGEAHAAAKAETHGKVDETLGVTSGSDGNYGLSAEQLKNATDVFGMFDQSGDGQISASELGSAFEAMGKKLTSAELNTMLQKVDTDGSGEISYSEFLSLVGPMIKKGGLVDSQQIMAASVDSFGELGEVVSTQVCVCVCVCVYRDDALAARARALSDDDDDDGSHLTPLRRLGRAASASHDVEELANVPDSERSSGSGAARVR